MPELAVGLAIRAVAFSVAVAVVAHRHRNVAVTPRWALPGVGIALAVLHLVAYRGLAVLLDLAALGMLGGLGPVAVNGMLVWLTALGLPPLRVTGASATAWLTLAVTAAHVAIQLV
ncbi:MAG: hypothetical protein D6689_02965 [Deltaproteobacteria bacterium]|nr:MAG: hypothetical protein D6689_02965 [Deltaproteobacteria bacterium]